MTSPSVTRVPVLAREPDLAAGEQIVEPAGVGAVAEAEQNAGRDPAVSEGAAQQGEGGDPIPPPTRIAPAAPGASRLG